MRIRQVILIINFDPKLGTFPQGNEVHSEYYGPRQRKYHVYSPKGHLYEGPMTRKMEVWGRDHVRSHCTANSTSDFDHQFWPKTGHFPKEVRSVTHATAPENANVTCTVPKDTYMKVQWQEKRRFEIGTTFSRTVLQIWPEILSINFDQNWAFPQGSEVRNACYGPRERKCHVYSSKDTYMKVQWQEKWRFKAGTTFCRTILQIWPVILIISFDPKLGISPRKRVS